MIPFHTVDPGMIAGIRYDYREDRQSRKQSGPFHVQQLEKSVQTGYSRKKMNFFVKTRGHLFMRMNRCILSL
jgi:hypothetical protein